MREKDTYGYGVTVGFMKDKDIFCYGVSVDPSYKTGFFSYKLYRWYMVVIIFENINQIFAYKNSKEFWKEIYSKDCFWYYFKLHPIVV